MDVKRLAAALALGGSLWIAPVNEILAQEGFEDTGPPVASPLAKEPVTPEELFDATLFMLQLGKSDLAKYYIDKLIAADPDDATLLRIRDKHSTAVFLEMVLVEEIAQPAQKLSERLQAATRNHVAEPTYLPSLLQKLSGSSRERTEAIDELRFLGSSATPALLKELQAPQNASRNDLIYALTRLDKDAVGPMIGALDAPNVAVQIAAAEVLGVVGGEREAIWLQQPAFSEASDPELKGAARMALARILYKDSARTDRLSGYGASDRLLATAIEHLKETYPWPANDREDALRSVWSWDPAAGTIAESLTSEKHASIFFAERLARDAAILTPDRSAPVTALLAAIMQRDMEQVGWNVALPIGPGTAHDLAVTVGPEACEQVLVFAQEHNLIAAQIGSLQGLSLNGSTSLLAPKGAVSSPVVKALDSSEPRVQFAAAVTVLTWEPNKPFQGSRRIVEILARALQSQDTPSGVVIDPNSARRSETAGLLNQVGFSGLQAATGVEGFQQAVGRGDVELAVVHPNSIRWELTDTIANLRRDSRTANLPIVIYGPPELRSKMTFLTSRYQRVAYVDQAADSADLNRQLKPFLSQLSPPAITPEQRATQAADALYWLQRISQLSGNVFDISPAEAALSSAANDPKYALEAIPALAAIPTASAQQRLLALSLAPAVQANIRQRAALQLAFHIQRFGSKLGNTELEQLATAAQAETEPLVQTSLLSVVGSLKPAPAAVRKQALAFPMSQKPVTNAPIPAMP